MGVDPFLSMYAGTIRRVVRAHRKRTYGEQFRRAAPKTDRPVRLFKGKRYWLDATDADMMADYSSLREYFVHEFDGVNGEAARAWRKKHLVSK